MEEGKTRQLWIRIPNWKKVSTELMLKSEEGKGTSMSVE